uniref:CTCK domain-containing protein n=1 Tax=Callorhinchus milii TaxID=7868 RepID=A0A4W3JUR8_CALMI|eukprot:gi/632949600/ref/XP_007890246.1/ PREDICTED: cerberus [Callorhinchus milii]
MHLLPIKLLVIVTLITSVQGKNLPKKTRRRPLFLVSGSQQRKENGSELGIVELSLISHLEELPEASTVLEGVTRGQTNKQMTQKTEQSQVLPMSSPAKESARGSLGDIKRKESPTASDDAFGVQSRSTPPDPKFAKKFWNHFLVRRGSALQDLILPMKADEMQQETCGTVPFSQSITHKDCEQVVLQNNLCFGKCSSFHVPGAEDRFYTFCSHCLPTQFHLINIQLKCKGGGVVGKVLMMVEKCKCEVQQDKHLPLGLVETDLNKQI